MKTHHCIVMILLFSVILSSCQPEQVRVSEEDHLGCQPREITEGTCTLAEEDSNNVGLFETINEERVQTRDAAYSETATGFLAQPAEEGTYPGVIMIHEWWGLNDNIKTMAKLLAQEGYVVLAVDLYEGKVATTSEEAGSLAGTARANPEQAVANMQDAASFLRGLPNVDGSKIASVGWCFGGGQSLQLAISGEKLAATVIYYGSLTDDREKLSSIAWPVLGIFGEEDTSIPVSSVNAFEKSLNALGIENEIFIYPGVGHAFANPSGQRYAPEETKDAWEKTLAFLGKHLK
ncbi:MAG TPA: dienelactone hydrolase family protein [Candidatus Nanoarchaeia archaeon]|nr:dienelactone hydrolase family protein [Candidatus Nanoarchaeia archaeon]